MNLQAWVSEQEALDVMPSMDLPAIPQEHDWPAEVTQQFLRYYQEHWALHGCVLCARY